MMDGPHVSQPWEIINNLNTMTLQALYERQQLKTMVEHARFRDEHAVIREGPPDMPSGVGLVGYSSRRPTMSLWGKSTFI